MLLALILAGFPIEVPPGGTISVSGFAPRVVADRGEFIVVWVDDRRAWVDSRKAESLFTATVRVDGGVQVVRTQELALGTYFSDELSVSVSPAGQLLAAWIEEPTSNGLWRLRWAVRENAAVSRGNSAGFTDSLSSVTSAWSGSNATIVAVQPNQLVVWSLDGGAAPLLPVSFFGPGGTSSITAGSTDGGGVTFAVTNGLIWRQGTLSSAPVFTALDGGSGTVRLSHVVLDPASAGLLLRSNTHFTIVHSAGLLDAGPAPMYRAPLSFGWMQGRGRFVVGLSTGVDSADVRFFDLDGGAVRTASLTDSSEVFVAASPTTALAAVSRVSAQKLDLLEGSSNLGSPSGLGLRPAMSNSLSVTSVGSRWVLAWQERILGGPEVRLQPVEADSGLGMPSNVPNLSQPVLRTGRDGGVFLVGLKRNAGGMFTGTAQRLSPQDLSFQPPDLAGLPGAMVGVIALGDGVFGWSSNSGWAFRSPASPSPMGPSVPQGFTLTEGGGATDSEAWVLGYTSMGGLVRLLFVTPFTPGTTARGVEQSSGSMNVSASPQYATVAPRRRSDGTWAALVGVAETETDLVRWSVLTRDGGATVLAPMDGGTRFVAVARPQSWVWVLSRFVPGSQGPGVGNGRVWAHEVFEDGGVSADIPIWSGTSVVGVPVAAVNEAGEVGVAWPLLEQGMPELRFTVLFARDGGPSPVDAGAVLNDGGAPGDAGVGPSPDAGRPDAGGPSADAGPVEPPPDAGRPDAGGSSADAGPVEPPPDAGLVDAGLGDDGGRPDGVDAGPHVDGGGTSDGGMSGQDFADAGAGNRGSVVFLPASCGCAVPGPSVSLMLLAAWGLGRRTRRNKPGMPASRAER
jgi:hypothetical protein